MSDIGEEKLITNEDSHFVFVRPKAIVGYEDQHELAKLFG